MRMLYDRGYEKRDILELFRFIDWLLVLPEEVESIFWAELESMEKERNMPYVTSVERIGIKKGILQGAREMVLEALSVRFGTVPEDVAKMVLDIQTMETLKTLLQQALKSESPDMFRKTLVQAKAREERSSG